MTFLATWPGSAHKPPGREAFDDERAALARAQVLTGQGVAHVTVFEVDDERIEGMA